MDSDGLLFLVSFRSLTESIHPSLPTCVGPSEFCRSLTALPQVCLSMSSVLLIDRDAPIQNLDQISVPILIKQLHWVSEKLSRFMGLSAPFHF